MAAEQETTNLNAAESTVVSTEGETPPISTNVLGIDDKSKVPVPKTKGKKRKAKAPRDVTAPRQPLTGYVRYLNERRETLRAANPRLGFAEVTRRLASEWGRLPVQEKQQYLDAAEQDRERYIKEWSLYKETDAYRTFRQQQLDRKGTEGKGVPPTVGSPPPKRQRPAAQAKPPLQASKIDNHNENASSDPLPTAMPNGGAPPTILHSMVALGAGSVLASNRPKTAIVPVSTVTPPLGLTGSHDPVRGGTDPSQRETDIPIFTEQFLQHNKLRETELRQLRKANTDYEQQNAILQKHIENMRGAVERARTDSAMQRSRTTMLRGHLSTVVDSLVRGLNSVPLPGGFTGASKQNIEQYMESLRALAAENKNHAAVRQAREFLNRMEMPS